MRRCCNGMMCIRPGFFGTVRHGVISKLVVCLMPEAGGNNRIFIIKFPRKIEEISG